MSLDPVPPVPFPLPMPLPSIAVFPPLGFSYLLDNLTPTGFVFPFCLFSLGRPFCSNFPHWVGSCAWSVSVPYMDLPPPSKLGCNRLFPPIFSLFFLLFFGFPFGSSGIWQFAVLCLLQVCHAPPPHQASIASSNCGVSARSRPSFPSLDPLFFGFHCFLLRFLYICFGFPIFVLVFCCIAFLSVFVFFWVFCNFCQSSPCRFHCPPSTVGLFSRPIMTSFHRALFCTELAYTRSVSFLLFILLAFSSAAFLFLVFRLLFVCNNALALMVCLDPLWSWLVCHGCICYPSFRVEEKKWSKLLCRGWMYIIV